MPPARTSRTRTRRRTSQTYDIEKEKLSTLTSGVRELTRCRSTARSWSTKRRTASPASRPAPPTAPKDDAAKEAKVDLSGWTVRVNPREEWKQMLHEAWRLQRDFFYDPKMHGVDWDGVWKQYGPLADRISSRDDLADLLGEMFGELNVGHAYHGGRRRAPGQDRSAPACSPPTCATTLRAASGRSRRSIAAITRCRTGLRRSPAPISDQARANGWSRLTASRSSKGEDYLQAPRQSRRPGSRAVDQRHARSSRAHAAWSSRRSATTRRSATPTWIREMRDYVDKKSNGQIGYIHLYDMGGLGLRQFARDYPPQWHRSAASSWTTAGITAASWRR